MTNYQYDTFKTESQGNNFVEYNEFYLKDFNFLPSLEVLAYREGNEEEASILSEIIPEELKDTINFSNGEAFPISMEKLKSFIEPVIKFRQRTAGETSYMTVPLRNCMEEDFESRGYTFEDDLAREKMKQRLCPNMEEMGEYLKLKNGYTN